MKNNQLPSIGQTRQLSQWADWKLVYDLSQQLIPPFRPTLEQNGRNFPKGKGISCQKLQIKITF